MASDAREELKKKYGTHIRGKAIKDMTDAQCVAIAVRLQANRQLGK